MGDMLYRNRGLLALTFILSTLVTVACQPAQNSADNTLVIYSGRSESLVGPLIEQFETTSGISVDVRWGSTGEMAALLLEEGSRSPADVFFAQDPGGLGAVANADLLADLPTEVSSLVPENFASDDGKWIGISGRARVVVYNTDAITEPTAQLPQDIFDFTNPEWSGKIGWAPTNGSFQAMVTAMRSVWGEEKTAEWLTGIQANEPVVYEKNTPTVAGTAAGEVTVGFVNHYYLYRFLTEEGDSFSARNHFLKGGGPGSLIMVSGAGILQTSDNADNAQKFIEFLLSTPSQQYFASQTFEYPLVDGVKTISGLPTLTELNDDALDIDVSDYDDLQGTVELLSELGILP